MSDLTPQEPEEQRARLRAAWEAAAGGWARQADHVREQGISVSAWMVEHAGLQPGQRVLELAAGPGDTGFMAAELIQPGGLLISSDGAVAMVAVARERAAELGVSNVEFKVLELEWIDLPTADVDVILCRWGLMLTVDPAAAVSECRRVLKPGGRLVAAVWDEPDRNPLMTIPSRVLVSLGLAEPPPPDGPGPFALSQPGALAELLRDGGFVDPLVEQVEVSRRFASVRDWIAETVDLSGAFNRAWRELDGDSRQAVLSETAEQVKDFTDSDGSVHISGVCLAVLAEA